MTIIDIFTFSDRLSVSQEGMISYAHLEMIPSTSPGETFKDLNGTFTDLPTDTFNDLGKKL